MKTKYPKKNLSLKNDFYIFFIGENRITSEMKTKYSDKNKWQGTRWKRRRYLRPIRRR
jgi:hypothetical protein